MARMIARKAVALDIRVIRESGVNQVRIFSEGSRRDGFDFYLQLLPAIERLNELAQRN